jgi:putative ATP-dependent endonuclease of OLD family
VAGLVRLGDGDAVAIEALPARVWETLARAQVTVGASTGAHLPLTRHGSGTQSLSVIFLHEVFLSVMLAQAYDKRSEPILAIEEPEAHLHPSAVRALWGALARVPGQKVVATHSGDLLAEVPLSAVRRLYRAGGEVRVGRLPPGTLTADDARRLDLHVRRTRGELLFARCWLLVEGQTEYWVFSETARYLGIDLECSGVRIVQFTATGVAPLIKLADDLGIAWHCVADGDQAGQNYQKTVQRLLGGRAEADCLTVLPYSNMEAFLCAEGFDAVYLPHLSPQKSKGMKTKPGDPGYWDEVAGCLKDKMKEQLAIEAMMEMRRKRSAPALVSQVVARVRSLAEV